MTTTSLSYRLNMDKDAANDLARQYWTAFPRIQPWLWEVVNECRKHGYVRYWSGRIWREETDEHMYKAANAVIQGGCHDMLMIAVNRVQDWLDAEGLSEECHIVNLVHDEIDLEVPEELVAAIAPTLQSIAEVPDLFGIPFLVDLSKGHTISSQEKFKP